MDTFLLGFSGIGCPGWFWGVWSETLGIESGLFVIICGVDSVLRTGSPSFGLEGAFEHRVLLEWLWWHRGGLGLVWGLIKVCWGFWYVLFPFMSQISWQICCILVIRCCVRDSLLGLHWRRALIGVHKLWLLLYGGYLDYSCLPHVGLVYVMSKGEHMGIWHNWAVYWCAQVIYGVAIVEWNWKRGCK